MKVEKRKGGGYHLYSDVLGHRGRGYHLYSDVLGQLSSTSFIANNYTYYKPKTCFLFTNKSKWVKKNANKPYQPLLSFANG